MFRSYGYIKYSTLMKTPFLLVSLFRNQWLQPTALTELRNKRLRSLIRHSYENVPYYRSLLKKAKLTPSDIRSIDDLQKIPILKKETLRNLPLKEITAKSADLNRCKIRRTSGTAGIPLSIAWDTQMRLIHLLAHVREMSVCGNKTTDRIAQIGVIWLPPHELLSKIGLYFTKAVSSSNPLEKQIEEIVKFKPDTLIGYPSHIRMLAVETKERGIGEIRPNLVFTGGEIVRENTREIIKDAFGAETFDHYACNEAGEIGYECSRREGYHVCSDLMIVEITKNNETLSVGEQGEITITNLCNYVGPLIRYNLEDIGFLLEEKCSCGRTFELMRIREGRKDDIVKLRDGKGFSAIELTEALLPVSGLKQFQIIQKEEDAYLVKAVKDIRFSSKTAEEVRERLREKLGQVEINVQIVNEIPREKSGKYKPFISK